jgi:hypothetical protein
VYRGAANASTQSSAGLVGGNIMTSGSNEIKAFKRQFAFIDESGTPNFDPNRRERGYVVVSTLIPEQDLPSARLLIPRRTNGALIKSSDKDATDELASRFLERLFERTRVQVGLVTAALSDQGNAKRITRMKSGINNSPFPRQSKPSIPDAIRITAAFSAIIQSLIASRWETTPHHVQIVFDRGSEQPEFMKKVRDFLCSPKTDAPLVIDDVQWVSRIEEPLIMVSDWIAGSVRRDIEKDDLPLTRQIFGRAKKAGRLHDQEGFKAHLPIEPN